MSGMQINLAKKTEQVLINLSKRSSGKKLENVNVHLALDVSGSMEHLFSKSNSPIVEFLENVCAISNAIDDDGILDLSVFDTSAYDLQPIDVKNDFDSMTRRVRGIAHNSTYWSGTNFAPSLELIYNKYFKTQAKVTRAPLPPAPLTRKDGFSLASFFGFGKKEAEQTTLPVVEKIEISEADAPRQLILLVTDGESSAERATLAMLDKLQNYNCFIQFVSVCSDVNKFLIQCEKEYSNVGYSRMSDFNKDTEQVISNLLSDKLINFF